MKIFSHLIKVSLVFTWLLTSGTLVRSQSGNMSDITGPMPGEMIPNDNQSDITGPNPDETPGNNEGSADPVDDGGETVGDNTEDATDPVADGNGDEQPIADGDNEEDVADGESEIIDEDEQPIADGDNEEDVADGESEIIDEDEQPIADGDNEEDVADGESEIIDEDEQPIADGDNEEQLAEETPVDGEEQLAEETPVDGEPIAEETPVDGEEQLAEETPVDGEEQLAEETPVDGEEQLAEETPVDGEPIAEEIPVDGEEQLAEETPIDGEPIAEETPVDEPILTEEPTTPEETLTTVEGGETPVNEQILTEELITPEETLTTVEGEETPVNEPILTEEPTTPEETLTTVEGEETPVDEPILTEEPTTPEETLTTTTEEDIAEEPNEIDLSTEETVAEEATEARETDNEVNDTQTEETAKDSETLEEVTEDEAVAQNEEEVTEDEAVAQTEEEATEDEAVETEEESETESEEETEEEAESKQSDFEREVDRLAYEVQVQQASTDMAIQMNEEFQTTQLIDHSGVQIYGQAPSAEAISQRLGQLWQQTGKKSAFINISLQSDQLEAFLVLPNLPDSASQDSSVVASNKINSPEAQQAIMRSTLKGISREELLKIAKEFRQEVSDVRNIKQDSYLQSSQELYQALIAPIEKELEANDIDILVFSMDTGLRLLPIAALHDGEQFLIEKYALALVPSFGLTDTRYVNPSESQILAMGASQFEEQTPLPAMPIELESVTSNPREGEIYLNEEFTIDNFKEQNRRPQPFSIIHLGTHAEFQTENLNESYIQFYDEKMEMSQLRDITDELGWNSAEVTPIELLVLSACQTALGDEQAELGFAGLAVQAGVKSALASLWQVSDLGTLALMSEFYDQLSDTLIKAEALRQTQLQMLQREVKIDDGIVQLSNGENLSLPASFPQGDLSMSHPYFWSAFTLIGNWN